MKNPWSFLMLMLGLASAAVFVGFQNQLPLAGALVTKLLPTALLLFWVRVSLKTHPWKPWLLLGLGLSFLGDLLMEFSGDLFIFLGILANGTGLVFYIICYSIDSKRTSWGWLIPLSGGTLILYGVIFPNLGPLALPVLGYCGLLVGLLWRAFSRLTEPSLGFPSRFIGVLGAGLFMFSDSNLSLVLFRVLEANLVTDILVMGSWYGGLLCIALTPWIKSGRFPKKSLAKTERPV